MAGQRALSIGFVILALAATSGCAWRRAPARPPPAPRAVQRGLPDARPTIPQGSPAIAVHRAGTPAFGLEAARAYALAHPLPGYVGPGKAAAVSRAEFLTGKQVGERLRGVATGFPDDHPLCFVELQGPFRFHGPPGAAVTYARGFMAFDARTGNFVMSGGLP